MAKGLYDANTQAPVPSIQVHLMPVGPVQGASAFQVTNVTENSTNID